MRPPYNELFGGGAEHSTRGACAPELSIWRAFSLRLT